MFKEIHERLTNLVIGKECYYKDNTYMRSALITRVDINSSNHGCSVILHVKYPKVTTSYRPGCFALYGDDIINRSNMPVAFLSISDYQEYYGGGN